MAVITADPAAVIFITITRFEGEKRKKVDTDHSVQPRGLGHREEGWETLTAEEGSAGRREGPAWVRAGRLDLGGSEASTEPAPQALEVRPAFSSRHSGPKSPVRPTAQGAQFLPGPGMCFQSSLISDLGPEFFGRQGPRLHEADIAQLLGRLLLHSHQGPASS